MFLRSKQLAYNFWKILIFIMGPLCINFLGLMDFIKCFTAIHLFLKPSAYFFFCIKQITVLVGFYLFTLQPLIFLQVHMAVMHDSYEQSASYVPGIVLSSGAELFKKQLFVLQCVLVAQSSPTLCNTMELQPARLLCPWNSPGKNTGVGCQALLQGIYPTQGSNLGLSHCRHVLSI